MDGVIGEVILTAPSLAGIGLLAYYLLIRLRRCEETRETLAAEHADLRVRIAVLETAVNGKEKTDDGKD